MAVAVVFAVASESALARSGRSGGGHAGGRYSSGGGFSSHHFIAPRARIGAFVAAPLFFYSPPPAYYNSPFFAASPQPPVYIEQGAATEAPVAGSWYYCAGSQAYYPYVKECPEGWQPVAPVPEPAPAL